MGLLKKLVALNGKAKKKDKVQSSESVHIDDTQTYYDSGYSGAIAANGASKIFRTCLVDVYQKFKERCEKDVVEQNKLHAPYKVEKEKQRSTLNARETLKLIKEDEISEVDASIEKINCDISAVKSAPEKYGIEVSKKPKAQFFIGLILLLPITLYLLVFYISASYSAFFKKFDPTEEIIGAIFDANAFGKALNDGWLEVVFVSTIPFAFMGLGYLIHMFQKEKRTGKYKIIALFLVTFIFDSILAYQIEQKIYDVDNTLLSPEFNLQTAFAGVGFWGQIFAGFVVYVIWGLLFDLVMKEYEGFDKIKVFIKKLKEDKLNLKIKKEELNEVINKLKQEISEINGKITELNSKIDGFIFPNRRYLRYHAEYVKGWYMAIAEEIALSRDRKDELIQNCDDISTSHLKNYEVDNEDFEGVIYKKDLNN